jgi:hypothetical protein
LVNVPGERQEAGAGVRFGELELAVRMEREERGEVIEGGRELRRLNMRRALNAAALRNVCVIPS